MFCISYANTCEDGKVGLLIFSKTPEQEIPLSHQDRPDAEHNHGGPLNGTEYMFMASWTITQDSLLQKH